MATAPKSPQAALQLAERQVREAAASAVLAGDYSRANELIGTAQQLAILIVNSEAALPTHSPEVASEQFPPTVAEAVRPNAKTPQNRSGYPRFSRDGHHLVKTGWSKTAKTEYEHRCPETVCQSLISSIRATAARHRTFAIEEILPSNSYVPAYQAYLVVAWLRSERLLEQHGRRGYTIVSPNDFETRAASAWQHLPAYRRDK